MTLMMVVMLFMFGPRHPRVIDEDEPLDGRRIAVAVFALVMFILCFTPDRRSSSHRSSSAVEHRRSAVYSTARRDRRRRVRPAGAIVRARRTRQHRLQRLAHRRRGGCP